MSASISWILEVAIHPGKLNDFRSVAADLIAASQSEPGTLDYEWNLSADSTVCHIFERYKDSEALLKHVLSFGTYARRFMESCHPTRFDVYGTPSDAAKAALAELHPVYFLPIGGFSR
jgi:quinol monooxygenase YgiN